MRSPEHILRHIVRCDWRCKHCEALFGSERIAHYGTELPALVKPTWFFAAMGLLDHLRDCPEVGAVAEAGKGGMVGVDFSAELSVEYGGDFLNHAEIYNWYNVHAVIERHFVAEEELE